MFTVCFFVWAGALPGVAPSASPAPATPAVFRKVRRPSAAFPLAVRAITLPPLACRDLGHPLSPLITMPC